MGCDRVVVGTVTLLGYVNFQTRTAFRNRMFDPTCLPPHNISRAIPFPPCHRRRVRRSTCQPPCRRRHTPPMIRSNRSLRLRSLRSVAICDSFYSPVFVVGVLWFVVYGCIIPCSCCFVKHVTVLTSVVNAVHTQITIHTRCIAF